MGYLGATLTQVFTYAGVADVSLRDVTIAQMGNGQESVGDVTHRKRAEDLGDFEKVSWVLPREKTFGFRLLAEARLVALCRVPLVMGEGQMKKSS